MLAVAHSLPLLAREAPLSIDACALLDAGAIQQVLGVSVEKGERRDSGIESNGAYSSACVWMLTADAARKSFVILNALRYPRGSDGARTYLQAFRDASDSGVLPSKPSPRQLGDGALWWGDGLAVRRRDVSFGVSVLMRPTNPAVKSSSHAGEREERLAKVILSRLDAQASR